MQFVAVHLDQIAIVRDYKSGSAVADLAEQHNVGIHIIYSILKKHKIERIKGRFKKSYIPHNKSDIKDEDIVRLHAQKHSFSNIARILGCRRNIVTARAHSMGLKTAGFSFGLPTNLKGQIGELAFNRLTDRDWLFEQYIAAGKPTRVIAIELGCGKKAVTTALKRHKIPLKRLHRGFFKSQHHKCRDFWCDSTWEMRIAKRLDEDDMVVRFIKEPFPIPYNDSGKTRRYFPDFLVWTAKGEFLLEIKPDEMLPFVEKKTQAAAKSGFNFVVLNLKDKFPWG